MLFPYTRQVGHCVIIFDISVIIGKLADILLCSTNEIFVGGMPLQST